MKIVKVGKTPEEKIEPDKLDGDVDTTEAIQVVNYIVDSGLKQNGHHVDITKQPLSLPV